MPPETTVVSTAKWIRECRSTEKPGDMMLADGTRLNIRSVPGVAHLLQTAPASAAPAPVQATLPVRKAGLWELRSIFASDALPPQSQRQCVNAEVDAEMIMTSSSNPADTCTQTVERDGSGYVIAGKCVGRITTLARAVITGNFESALTAQITVQREDGEPLATPNRIVARQDQRWLSACTSDMQPGDIVTADGTKRNIREMRKVK